MNILLISDNYPSKILPNIGVFVYKLAQELIEQGHNVTVIAPFQLVPRNLKRSKHHYGKERCKVYRPLYLSLSTKQIGSFNTYTIAKKIQINSIKRLVKKHKIEFDVVYCHFIKNALIGVAALKSLGKPIVAAVGENKNIELVKRWYNKDKYSNLFRQIDGFVAVSPMLKDKLQDLGADPSKIIVAPNGTNLEIFYPQNNTLLREEYGFPKDKFYIAFIGRLTHEKGALRLLNAVKDLDNIVLMFMGEGNQKIEGNQVLLAEKVTSTQVPKLLACADVFVLPTLHEGSSNAIVEAMASGLPIISSDIPEVKVQCTPEFSILVDPMDETAIRDAIIKIKDNPTLRASMSKKARLHAENNFDLSKRANNIVKFIKTI